ncbi:amidohydrolase family protein [Candidatus Poribacteria bacterium]|nr:amidohydrolase family protein [Candidatus Poribacteria bacterium]
MDSFKVFDSHVHVGSVNGQIIFQGKQLNPFPNSELKGIEEVLKYLQGRGIDKCLVIPFYTFDKLNSPFEQFNPLVMECVSKLENVYGALWITPNSTDEKYLDEVLDLATYAKIRAFKTTAELWEEDVTPDPMSWSSRIQRNMNKIIDFAIKHNLPIQFHTSGGKTAPEYFENFFKEYGNSVKIHFVHMGMNTTVHFKFIPLFISWLKQGYLVYCDTSLARGFAVRWLVDELVRLREGYDRIMFATDEPWGDFTSEYHKIVGLEVDEQYKRRILYDNAQSLYG